MDFYSSKSPKKESITAYTKVLSSTTVFNIDNELQISIWEWFLKDHVTLIQLWHYWS